MQGRRTNRKLSLAVWAGGADCGGVVLIPARRSRRRSRPSTSRGTHAPAADIAHPAGRAGGGAAGNGRFHGLDAAMEAGYELGWVNGPGVRIITGCIAHPTAGAMGYHYFNQELIDDLVVDELEPEALVYASGPNGRLKLVAVEWVVPGANSNPPGASAPPSVFGMKMHIINPAVGFYLRHAWIWKPQPGGAVRGLEPRGHLPVEATRPKRRERTGRTDAVRPPGLELIAEELDASNRATRADQDDPRWKARPIRPPRFASTASRVCTRCNR